MNRIITIYGEIDRDKIYCKDEIYQLKHDSKIHPRKKGWFHLLNENGIWRLRRVLYKDEAEIYPGWIDENSQMWIDFVRIRESVNEGKMRPLSQPPISRKLTFFQNSLSISEFILQNKINIFLKKNFL